MNPTMRVLAPVLVCAIVCSSAIRPTAVAVPEPDRSTGGQLPKFSDEGSSAGTSHAIASIGTPAPRPTPIATRASQPTPAPAPALVTSPARKDDEQKQAAFEALARAPLAFERQDDGRDAYVVRTPAYTLHVSAAGAEIQPRRASAPASASETGTVRMRLIDANTDPQHVAGDALPGTVSYLVGNDPARWRTNVATYARVRFDAVYPGVDLVYYGSQREIEYDFIVAPGSSPNRIALAFDGIEGLSVRDNGDLALTHRGEALVLRAPRAYQTIGGRTIEVAAHYRLPAPPPSGAAAGDADHDAATLANANQVAFEIGDYDRTQPLVIDPILSYSTALGGSSQDEGNAVAVDAAGNVYVAGLTLSTNFPATGTPGGNFDLFVTKFDSSGTVVLNSSYVGGSGPDETRGLAIDADGNAYLSGVTRSPNFPTRNPIQAALSGESDAFVVKIATNGSGLVFSTYLGGTGLDEGAGIAVDNARNVYVTGVTRSTDFPTASALSATARGMLDSFVTKLNAAGSSLVYSTYLGGSDSDQAHGIAVDGGGDAVVVGTTMSTDFPVGNGFQGTNRGLFDAFVCRFTPSGVMLYSTYLGGSQMDAAQSVTILSSGHPVVTGSTASTDFPLLSPAQGTHGGSLDAFVVGFGVGGGNPFFSTLLGGSGSDRGRAITRDTADRLYIAGQTFSQNFPAANAAQSTIGGNRDTFVAMLAPPYSAFTYATYVGGSNNDDGLGVAADKLGRAYVTGATMFAWPDLAGASDAFVFRLSSLVGAGVDTDMDNMPDDWETQFAETLDELKPTEDSDGDGITNLGEYQAGTHPLGFFTRYLAEGATGQFFDTQLALFNPGNTTAKVLLRFQREGQSEISQLRALPAHSRQTIIVEGIAGLENTSFSTVAEADTEVTLDRTMTWDATAFGSSAETAASELSRTWYLAEGATHGQFSLFYLLQNPNAEQANVTVRFLRPDGLPPIDIPYTVAPRGRITIDVDNIQHPVPNQRPFAATDISAVILSDRPILAERSMYMTVAGRLFAAGHESMGITAPSKSWFFAEGATGAFFDMYLLLANPGTIATDVTIDYLFAGGGTLTRTTQVGPQSRKTLSIDLEAPELFDAAVSMKVRATSPIIAERAMWWPSGNWQEAHNSAGALVTSSRWAVAEGELGGTRNIDTYVLIANTSAAAGDVRVSVFLEDGQMLAPRTFNIPGNSRFNVDIRGDFENAEGSRFSVLVEGLGATPPELVVERAMYSTSNRVVWAAGTNSLGSPLFPANTFILFPGGVFPKKMVVTEGERIRFINISGVPRQMSSDEHPLHQDCPPINDVGFLADGQSGMTGNMVLDAGRVACGFHDHDDDQNDAVRGRIVVRQ